MVAQSYEVEADNEYVIRGNSAIMKCEVPSFVSDFVMVENWQDSKGNTYLLGENYGTHLVACSIELLGCCVKTVAKCGVMHPYPKFNFRLSKPND